MDKPTPLAREAAHDTVEDIFRKLPIGKVLDVPAGEGALAVRLRALGFDVACCDLHPQLFKAADIDIRPGDLDERLPYDDRSFDHVACIEGLEHIENPANAIREFARILEPGGTLVASVPNIMNIEERLKWLFSGYTSHFKPLSEEVRREIRSSYDGHEEAALHVSPIGYSEMRFLLERSGFRLESCHRDEKKKNAWAFFPIVWLIRGVASFTPRGKRDARWIDAMNADEVLLGGNTLIFKATKL